MFTPSLSAGSAFVISLSLASKYKQKFWSILPVGENKWKQKRAKSLSSRGTLHLIITKVQTICLDSWNVKKKMLVIAGTAGM